MGAGDRRRPPAGERWQYPSGTTFHPTFLYESLWNLGLVGLILWLDKRFKWAGGQLLAVYVLGYGVGRFWVEGLRIDEADELGPLRWNQWVALALIVGGAAYLIVTWNSPASASTSRRRSPPDTDDDDTAALAVATADLDGTSSTTRTVDGRGPMDAADTDDDPRDDRRAAGRRRGRRRRGDRADARRRRRPDARRGPTDDGSKAGSET